LLAVTIHVIWFLVEFVFPAISWGIQFIEDNISWFDIAVSISSVNCSMLNAQLDG
jgi:steroid 5-alpha reductase family enzyme